MNEWRFEWVNKLFPNIILESKRIWLFIQN